MNTDPATPASPGQSADPAHAGAWAVYEADYIYTASSIHATEAAARAAAGWDGVNVVFWRFGEDLDVAIARAIQGALSQDRTSP